MLNKKNRQKIKSEKDKDKEILRRIGQFKTCYQFFKKNTAMAMFLLLGAYLSRFYFFALSFSFFSN